MSFLLQAIVKDLSRWRLDVSGILVWISIPFLIGGLMTFIMSDGAAKPRGTLLIADQDESLLSSLVAGVYSRGQLSEILAVEQTTADKGRKSMDDGEASGLLIIPDGFSDAFFDEEAMSLTLVTNPAQTILPGIIRDVTELLLDAGFYAQELFRDEIRTIRESRTTDSNNAELAAALALAIQQKIDTATPYLIPPAMEIRIVEPPSDRPVVPMALLYLPGIILMAVMFSANGLAADYWVEREQGTLRRTVLAPARLYGFVAAKALAAGIVIAIVGGLTLVAGFLYHGIGWERLLPSLLWIAVSGIALFSWFSVLQMIGSTRRAANLITSMLLFPLLMAGGSFFPLDALPGWIAAIGRATPNGFIADHLAAEITGATAWTFASQSWLLLIALAGSGLLLSSWRMQSGFARG
ncbi:MAG: ABC transporter permease [Gammaproteobacteria bacterium]|nr:ABC transporter permease [Gammaproteobacteria bacterium]MDH4313352.1 ABC transporter permease [Gammaproteobacteria bacterium]MDH5214003.1 ABC transporter permease [Gammaproteobacteria bacterium]MDH5500721.1 ABC transporter permease [Gammaproteobacteria bacterium]